MPFNPRFRLPYVKFLLTNEICNYCKIVPKKSHWKQEIISLTISCLKLLVDFKASKLSQLGHFLFYFPFKGGYFRTVDLEMGVHVRLQEMSAYGRLKMQF